MESSIHSNPLNPPGPSTQTPNLEQGEGNQEDSITKQSIRKRKGGSIMWQHNTKVTKILEDGSETYFGVCHYCNEELKADSNKNGTSAMLHHHRKRCKASPLYQGNNELKGQSILSNDTMGGGALVSHNFSQKRCEQKVIEFVIMDEMPFRVVEGKGFLSLVHEFQPRFKVPNRRKVAAGVFDLFLAEKAKIESVIRGQRVSITTDAWTSIQNINYMVITAHFMDNDWKLHKKILSFTKITSHSGDDIGKKLKMCLNDWGIERVFSITVDNASSNNTAIEFMKKRFKNQKTLMLDGIYLHMRCACHILNLIVVKGLDEVKSSVKGIRNAVFWIHSSPSRLAMFRDYAILEKLSSVATVPMDVKTRWNATFKMLQVALKFKRVFDRMAEECRPYVEYFNEKVKKGEKEKTRVGPPVEEDWIKAESFVHFLGLFYECTLTLSATKTCTSHLLFPSIMAVQQELDMQASDFLNITLNQVALSMLDKFEKYWNLEDVNPLVLIAHVLDPRSKFQMIRVCLSEIGWSDTLVEGFVKKITVALQSLWLEYKGGHSVTDGGGGGGGRVQFDGDGSSLDGTGPAGASKLGLLSKMYGKVKNQNGQLYQTANEVDKYLADSVESIEEDTDFSLLDRWKGSETRYPIISKIAKDILAVPSSTVASESAFSLGRRIVDPFRSNLSPKMVEVLVCANDWLRAEEFSLYKDPTDEELQLYQEIEEIEALAAQTQNSVTTPTQPSPSASTVR